MELFTERPRGAKFQPLEALVWPWQAVNHVMSGRKTASVGEISDQHVRILASEGHFSSVVFGDEPPEAC